MLNEYLSKVQSENVEIRDCGAHVGSTGIAQKQSANQGATRLAKLRLQRMRRRQQRSALSGSVARGWVARIA